MPCRLQLSHVTAAALQLSLAHAAFSVTSLKLYDLAYISNRPSQLFFRATDDASLAWPRMLHALCLRHGCNWSERGGRVKCGCHLRIACRILTSLKLYDLVADISNRPSRLFFRATDDASLAWPRMLPALCLRQGCNWSEGGACKVWMPLAHVAFSCL